MEKEEGRLSEVYVVHPPAFGARHGSPDDSTHPAQLRFRDRRRMERPRAIAFVQQDRRQPPDRRGGLDRRSIYQPPQTRQYSSTPESATPPVPARKSP